ncbi:hypothetical protein NMY22_g19834 [Coprinellus aureogranulatus]|nr:hypothetical protein NMY22_g19834 [Coprinellus aureogranulatus]
MPSLKYPLTQADLSINFTTIARLHSVGDILFKGDSDLDRRSGHPVRKSDWTLILILILIERHNVPLTDGGVTRLVVWARFNASSPLWKRFRDPYSGPGAAHVELVVGKIEALYLSSQETRSTSFSSTLECSNQNTAFSLSAKRSGSQNDSSQGDRGRTTSLNSPFPDPDSISESEWEEYIRNTVTMKYHGVGTASMSPKGADGELSILTCVLLKGVTGVRIVDASVTVSALTQKQIWDRTDSKNTDHLSMPATPEARKRAAVDARMQRFKKPAVETLDTQMHDDLAQLVQFLSKDPEIYDPLQDAVDTFDRLRVPSQPLELIDRTTRSEVRLTTEAIFSLTVVLIALDYAPDTPRIRRYTARF